MIINVLPKKYRFFFHLAFNGLNYHGWQRQVSAVGVQEVIEAALKKVLKTRVTINGGGRTDAQVHASQYVFHADLAEAYDFDLLFRLNHTLPPDIAIFDLLPCSTKGRTPVLTPFGAPTTILSIPKKTLFCGAAAPFMATGRSI